MNNAAHSIHQNLVLAGGNVIGRIQRSKTTGDWIAYARQNGSDVRLAGEHSTRTLAARAVAAR
jgi:hypothetical protein